MVLFDELIELQQKLSGLEHFEQVLTEIVDNSNFITVEIDEIHSHLNEQTVTYYLHKTALTCEECIREDIEIDFGEVEARFIHGILYIANKEKEEAEVEKSPSLQTLDILMLYLNSLSDDNIVVKNAFLHTVLFSTLRKLKKRLSHGYQIPAKYLYDMNIFLGRHQISFNIVRFAIEFLITLSLQRLDMLPDLGIYDKNCDAPFLAFVCLTTIMNKKYLSTEKDIKANIVFVMFTMIVNELISDNRTLTPTQKAILQSNYCSFIRQATRPTFSETKDIVMAVGTVCNVIPPSKEFVFLLNQIPFPAYRSSVLLLVKISKTKYKPSIQEYCCNMFESPYITVGETHIDELKDLLCKLLEAIVWPLKTNDKIIITSTVKHLDRIMRIQNPEINAVLKHFFCSNTFMSDIDILNYIYQFSDAEWRPSAKQINQYFISVFCQIQLISGRIPLNGYEQFKILVGTANLSDLLPCLSVLMQFVRVNILNARAICKLLLSKFIQNSINPHRDSSKYLVALRDLIFVNNPHNSISRISYVNAMFGFQLNMHDLIRKMVESRMVNSAAISELFGKVLTGENYWGLLSVLLPHFPVRPLPQAVTDYWKKSINDECLLMSDEISLILDTVVKLMDTKSMDHPKDKLFLRSVADYLFLQLDNRSAPVAILGRVVLTLKRILEYLRHDEAVIESFFEQLRETIKPSLIIFKNSGNFSEANFIDRDLLYYGEIYFVFGYKIDVYEMDIWRKCLCATDTRNCSDENELTVQAILRCCTQIAIRSGEILKESLAKIRAGMHSSSDSMRIVCMYSLYDICLCRTSNFDMLLPYMNSFLKSTSVTVRGEAIKMYVRLMEGELLIPQHWQFYCIVDALADEAVERFCTGYFTSTFYSKCDGVIAKYFVNMMLFFNKCYNHPSCSLKDNQIRQLTETPVPVEKKINMYETLLTALSAVNQYKIMAEIEMEILQKFRQLTTLVGKEKLYFILQDVVVVSYVIMRQNNGNYAKNDLEGYRKTVNYVKALLSKSGKKQAEAEDNALIKRVLMGFVALLKSSQEDCEIMLLDLFHLILSIAEWYKGNMVNLLLEDGQRGHFRRTLEHIIQFYSANCNSLGNNEPAAVDVCSIACVEMLNSYRK